MTLMPKMGFRFDASANLGLGHLMRCSVLAQNLDGYEHSFWVREDPATKSLLAGRPAHYISPDLDIDEELAFLQREITTAGIDSMVVDFLRYPEGYIKRLKAMVPFLVSLHEYELDCPFSDMVVNYNSFKGFNSIRDSEDKCLGPSYVILREGVRGVNNHRPSSRVANILISMGGSDPNGVTFKAARALAGLRKNFRLIIHIGPAFKYGERLGELSMLPGAVIEDQVTELADLMVQADLAISAGGNTMYELCYLGVPSIIISQNAHQLEFAEGLAAVGAVRSIGLHSEITGDEIADAAEIMTGDFRLRRTFSERGREIIDGGGCERIVKKIMSRMDTVRHT